MGIVHLDRLPGAAWAGQPRHAPLALNRAVLRLPVPGASGEWLASRALGWPEMDAGAHATDPASLPSLPPDTGPAICTPRTGCALSLPPPGPANCHSVRDASPGSVARSLARSSSPTCLRRSDGRMLSTFYDVVTVRLLRCVLRCLDGLLVKPSTMS